MPILILDDEYFSSRLILVHKFFSQLFSIYKLLLHQDFWPENYYLKNEEFTPNYYLKTTMRLTKHCRNGAKFLWRVPELLISPKAAGQPCNRLEGKKNFDDILKENSEGVNCCYTYFFPIFVFFTESRRQDLSAWLEIS